ncbi:MAG: hypothetical protein OMM_11208, partial [Candidatus Magnetoglobus multicellularis str. Araruama]
MTTDNGTIALNTTGKLTINNRIDASQGAGNIALYAEGDMSIQDQIHAGTGHISILTDGRLTQGSMDNKAGDIIAGGTIDIQATSDILSYTDNTIQSDSTIRIDSDGTLSISSIDAGESVSILANTIVDSGTDDLDIQASHLRIETKDIKGGAGDNDNRLELSVDTFTAHVGEAGVNIHEMDGITIDTVPEISVYRIAEDGSIDIENALTDQSQSNIISHGDVNIIADTGDIRLDYIESSGDIDLTALSGAIFETQDDTIVDIKSGDYKKITLTASGNIAASQSNDDTYLDVAHHSTITAQSTNEGNIHLRADGELVLEKIETTDGNIDIVAKDHIFALDLLSQGAENDDIRIHNLSGDIFAGSLISAAQVDIVSEQGGIIDSQNDDRIDIIAGQNALITLTAAGSIGGINNTFLEFANNSIISANATTEGDIHLKGLGALTLEHIVATEGNIQIFAENDMIAKHINNSESKKDIVLKSTTGAIEAWQIVSGNNLTIDAGKAIIEKPGLITANDLLLNAETGIGDASNQLTLDINRLDADNLSNGIFVSNTKALTLADLDQNQHAILNESNADIVVETLEGHLTIAQTVKGYSDILLSSQSDNASITIEGSILTNQGNVSILADTDINQSATIISGGTVDIYAENGSITMADNYSTIAQGDNIRYQAKGDIVIENINAGPKDVCIYSETGNVYATPDSDHANITAANLRIDSANAIGTRTNHLNTLTDTLAVKASGHIYVSDHSSVTIDQVDSQAIQRVQRDGSTLTVVQDESQLTGLVCKKEGANIVIQTLNGDLTINAFESTIGNGNIRLFAGTGNIALNDQIASGTGHLSIIAEKSIMQNADILISGGTIDVSATDHISMNSGVVTQTLDNNILYESLQGNITINEINA